MSASGQHPVVRVLCVASYKPEYPRNAEPRTYSKVIEVRSSAEIALEFASAIAEVAPKSWKLLYYVPENGRARF